MIDRASNFKSYYIGLIVPMGLVLGSNGLTLCMLVAQRKLGSSMLIRTAMRIGIRT